MSEAGPQALGDQTGDPAGSPRIAIGSGTRGTHASTGGTPSRFQPSRLYTYFSNRDEIVASLLAESFARLDAYLRRVPGGLAPEERVVQLGMAYMDFARDNPVDLRCILSATSENLPPGSGASVGLEAARLIGQTFREGVEKGVFVPTRSSRRPRWPTACGPWCTGWSR